MSDLSLKALVQKLDDIQEVRNKASEKVARTLEAAGEAVNPEYKGDE